MLERILIAGAGGQGVILSGKLLATVATTSVEHVTFFPSYGAEVRGGTSHCQVILSSEPITSPVSPEFEVMIIMNQASADRFLVQARENTTVFFNSSMCQLPEEMPGTVIPVPASDHAIELGNTRVANFIMLGAYVAGRKTMRSAGVEAAITQLLAGKARALVELNMKAFHQGLEI